jgi:hypothetical protein
MTKHSPLGGSGAERYLACPGSVALSFGIDDEEDDTFSRPGTAAHALAEVCLGQGCDAWENIGHYYHDATKAWYPPDHPGELPDSGVLVDKEMADAVQVYLDAVRTHHADRNQGNFFVERAFKVPTLHKYYWGKADAIYVADALRTLHVWDYKHGAGIVVDATWNAQMMYYGCGVLEEFGLWGEIDTVVLHIVQPRGWHWAGPVRHWETTTEQLEEWLDNTLLPGMSRALASTETIAGEHCRFCPARARACPAIMAAIDELEELMTQHNLSEKGQAAKLTGQEIARILDLGETFKIAQKAALGTAFNRLHLKSDAVPGWKLAAKKANREWRHGHIEVGEDKAKRMMTVEELAVERFGQDAKTKPELKSPAQIEGLPGGDAFVQEYAFKPETGLTVVKAEDIRPAISRDTKSGFTPVKKGQKK